MLILLPPSEGKTAPRRGRSLDLDSLCFPSLRDEREAVAGALVRLSSTEPERARSILGLSARQSAELRRNATLFAQPTAAASQVYSGVLYEALGYSTLSPTARRRAGRSVVVLSGLFGLVRLHDRIPAYRLSGDTDLPGIGPLSAYWRPGLSRAIREALGHGVALDLRSGAYTALWPPTGEVAERMLVARVVQEIERNGSVARVVVSHHNKATKGRLVRALLESGTAARSIDALVAACQEIGATAGFRVEVGPEPRPGRPHSIDVVVDRL